MNEIVIILICSRLTFLCYVRACWVLFGVAVEVPVILTCSNRNIYCCCRLVVTKQVELR